MTNSALWTIATNRLIPFVQQAFQKVDLRGGTLTGTPDKMIRFMQNEQEMGRVAQALKDVDYAFEKATKPHYEAIRAADDLREAAEKALLETIF